MPFKIAWGNRIGSVSVLYSGHGIGKEHLEWVGELLEASGSVGWDHFHLAACRSVYISCIATHTHRRSIAQAFCATKSVIGFGWHS